MAKEKKEKHSKKKKFGTKFRFILIFLPILLAFLFIYFPWQEFNYSDSFIQEPIREQSFMKARVQLKLVFELLEVITRIPESLNYKQICFYNNGNPEQFYYMGEYLVITPNLVNSISVNDEIVIPYREEYCMTFKGNSYEYGWKFRKYLDLCNSSCMTDYLMASIEEKGKPENYTPPKHDNVTFILKDFPTVEHFDKSIPPSDYTNTIIKPEPISMVFKLFLFSIAWGGFILFGYRIKKLIKEGV